MKNLVAQKWIDECGTLFPIDGNTVLYPTPGSGIFELYQGKSQDKRIGLKKLSEKFEFNHKIYDVGCDNLFDIIQKLGNQINLLKGIRILVLFSQDIKEQEKVLVLNYYVID